MGVIVVVIVIQQMRGHLRNYSITKAANKLFAALFRKINLCLVEEIILSLKDQNFSFLGWLFWLCKQLFRQSAGARNWQPALNAENELASAVRAGTSFAKFSIDPHFAFWAIQNFDGLHCGVHIH